MRPPWKPVVLDEAPVDLSASRPLSSAVQFCVKGEGPLDEASLALAITVADMRGWRMDELVVGSPELAERARTILSGVHETMAGIPHASSVSTSHGLGPGEWFVRGGRA